MVFTTLTLAQMGNALATRSDYDSLFKIGLLSNKAMLASVLLTFMLQMAVIYIPFFQDIFDTVALTPQELAISLAISTIVFFGVETAKWIKRLIKKETELPHCFPGCDTLAKRKKPGCFCHRLEGPLA